MYFQGEVDRSGEKKRWFFSPRRFRKPCICRIVNNSGVLLSELMRTFHGHAMNGYSDSVNGRGTGSSKHFNSFSKFACIYQFLTLSLSSPSVTAELLGLLVWDLCQVEEISLAMLSHVQQPWKKRPLPLGRWMWKESDWQEFEPCLFEFQCL